MFNWFRRPPNVIQKSVEKWSLQTPLLRWSGHDDWTIGNSVEGTLILGATGSGKSSGSGQNIACSFLEAGYGGLVLTVKSEERRLWEKYCARTGRSGDLVIVGADRGLYFNFMDYELSRQGEGAGYTENIVALFSGVLEVAERNGGGSGREDEGYWRRACRQLLRNLIDLLVLSKGRISIPDLYRLVISAPTSFDQVRSADWKAQSFCFQCLAEADKRPKVPRQQNDFALVADYFMLEYPGLSDKTRSVVVSTFTSMIDVLNRGILRELFCTDTNITPDAAADGKIILIDLPVKEFAEVGQYSQVIWKNLFQKCMERRDVRANPRPVFLWADEAQHFVQSTDMMFQTTCRSARVATVLLSQNVSNFYAALGGDEKGKAEADSLFGNLVTKIFHANGDPVTNEWSSTLIGRTRQYFMNAGSSYQNEEWLSTVMGMGNSTQSSTGISESYEFEVQPSYFSRLSTGGLVNDCLVEGVIFRSNGLFQKTGRPWMKVTFKQ